ncbi:tetratricopeptide repeat protein [Chryseobacterium sp. 52]|uniref:hypothetical protein n=1 Tax=Chryseobacterium sp. 52 TaxID=2035213 RepID=UPI000C1921FC|nr:hypothetical protein [Chryseobacterium sp. 52]PIF45678.1 tetratricopeptide repeat protein [Chryseobacterium sp. 52]
MKFFLYSIFSLFLITCSSKTEKSDNDYFYRITEELTPISRDSVEIIKIKNREFEKLKKNREKKYALSYEYVNLFLYQDNDIKQIPFVYRLLNKNNDEYPFISMTSNFGLALKFENTSPKLAMQFIDAAIKYDEKMEERYYIGHLYHAKGRFYYNKKDYRPALNYFGKALKSFKQDEVLYIASMHNNFGLTYDKMNNIRKAISETETGIRILENKKKLRDNESDFLYSMKGILGYYYFKNKNYKESEKLLLQEFEYHKDKDEDDTERESVNSARKLSDLYSVTDQNDQRKKIIEYLLTIEPGIKKTYNKIVANEVIQKYYTDHQDFLKLKNTSEKLVTLNHVFDDENRKSIQEITNVLYNRQIKNINDRHDYEMNAEKSKNFLWIIISVLAFVIFIIILFMLRSRNEKEKIITEKQRQLLENNKKILEQDIKFQEEKIKNLHQNLNLKMETEKMFRENLIKIKKSKNIDAEQVLKDLLLKVNNLMQIDKRNHHETINESSIESSIFLKKLADRFPTLTNKELKLCVYFRMNLSSKEISSLEDSTTGTMRVYKTKIKSKLNLKREDDLVAFLSKL